MFKLISIKASSKS